MLRLALGALVEIHETSSKHNFRGEYVGGDAGEARIKILDDISDSYFIPNIHLLVAVVSNDACDFIVEKSTELGAASLNFFFADRSQAGSRVEKMSARLPRLERIALTALKQSGSPKIPEIRLNDTLAATCAKFEQARAHRYLALAPSQKGESIEITNLFTALTALPKPAGDQLEKVGGNADFLVLIGPEGGWSEEELSASLQHGFSPISLGPTTMRTETAALAALTLLSAFSSQP